MAAIFTPLREFDADYAALIQRISEI